MGTSVVPGGKNCADAAAAVRLHAIHAAMRAIAPTRARPWPAASQAQKLQGYHCEKQSTQQHQKISKGGKVLYFCVQRDIVQIMNELSTIYAVI